MCTKRMKHKNLNIDVHSSITLLTSAKVKFYNVHQPVAELNAPSCNTRLPGNKRNKVLACDTVYVNPTIGSRGAGVRAPGSDC